MAPNVSGIITALRTRADPPIPVGMWEVMQMQTRMLAFIYCEKHNCKWSTVELQPHYLDISNLKPRSISKTFHFSIAITRDFFYLHTINKQT